MTFYTKKIDDFCTIYVTMILWVSIFFRVLPTNCPLCAQLAKNMSDTGHPFYYQLLWWDVFVLFQIVSHGSLFLQRIRRYGSRQEKERKTVMLIMILGVPEPSFFFSCTSFPFKYLVMMVIMVKRWWAEICITNNVKKMEVSLEINSHN